MISDDKLGPVRCSIKHSSKIGKKVKIKTAGEGYLTFSNILIPK